MDAHAMDTPNFSDMSAEDILTLIDEAQAALDHKIAAEKAAIEERQTKLTALEARRSAKASTPRTKPATSRPRPAQDSAAKFSAPPAAQA